MKTQHIKDKRLSPTGEGIVIRMTRQEALSTIQSLASQMYHNSPNKGRVEMWTELNGDGQRHYFSIDVEQVEE